MRQLRQVALRCTHEGMQLVEVPDDGEGRYGLDGHLNVAGLKFIQANVLGLIELAASFEVEVPSRNGKTRVDVWCHYEGLLRGMPKTMERYSDGAPLYGPILFLSHARIGGSSREPDFADCALDPASLGGAITYALRCGVRNEWRSE